MRMRLGLLVIESVPRVFLSGRICMGGSLISKAPLSSVLIMVIYY